MNPDAAYETKDLSSDTTSRRVTFLCSLIFVSAFEFPGHAENRVLELDGQGDYVRLPDHLFENFTDATVECRVRWKRFNPFSQPISFGDAWQVLGVNTEGTRNVLQFFIYAPWRHLHLAKSPKPIELGRWHHLAAVSGKTGMQLYLDGELVAQDAFTGSFSTVAPTRLNALGRAPWLENADFRGQLDEVRVWRTCRSEQEIRSNLHRRLKGDEDGLAALWNFDAGDARDAGPGEYHGVLMGGARSVPEESSAVAGAAFEVSVTDALGQPAREAIVQLYEDGQPIETLLHDARGVYRGWVEVHPSAQYSLTATLGRSGACLEELGVGTGETERIALHLKEAISLSGGASAFDGSPHVAVPVQALRRLEKTDRWIVAATTLTDSNGKFEFVNLLPGTYLMRCQVWDGYVYAGQEQRTSADATQSPQGLADVSALGGTDYQPVPSGNLPDGTGEASMSNPGARFVATPPAVPVGRLPTGAGRLPAPPIFQTASAELGTPVRIARGFPRATVDFRFAPFQKGQWRSLTHLNGLPSNRVNAIAQDRTGLLWFGTDTGVASFDGQLATVYTTTDGLADNFVSAIHKDERGDLWFATASGISHFDGKRFVTHNLPEDIGPGPITAIGPGWPSGLFVGTRTGLASFGNGRFETLEPALALDRQYLPDWNGFATVGIQAAPGGTWQGLTAYTPHLGAIVFQGATNRFQLLWKDGLANAHLKTSRVDASGTVWAGTVEGLSCFDGERVRNWTMQDGLLHNAVNAITLAANGVLWLGTERTGGPLAVGGLTRFDGKRFVHFTEHDGLSGGAVLAVFQDRGGTLWVGTRNGGVFAYDPAGVETLTVRHGLPGNRIQTLKRTSEENLWIGTAQSGVARYDGEKFQRFGAKDGLLHEEIRVFFEDQQDRLWVGTRGGLSRFDGKRFESFPLPSVTTINAIGQDRNGTIWVSAGEDSQWGVLFRSDGQQFEQFGGRLGRIGGIRALCQDDRGNLWFGRSGEAPQLFDGTRFRTLLDLASTHDRGVCAMHFQAATGIWILTTNELVQFKGELLTQRLNLREAPDRPFSSLFSDDDGRFWFGSSRGVRLFDGFAWSVLEPVDGLSGRSVVAIERGERNDEVFLATDGGLTRYRRTADAPKLRIVSVKGPEPGERPSGRFHVKTGARVSIQYSAIDFKTHPSKRQYRRRLVSPAEDSALNLAPPVFVTESNFDFVPEVRGQYVFEVEAIDRDLNYSAPERVVFLATPPWYLNGWLLSPALATGASLLVFAGTMAARYFGRRRIQQLERQHAAQQAFSRQLIASQEQERTRIAAEIHDSLGQNLLVIKNLALLGQAAPANAGTAPERFGEVSILASQTIKEMRSIAYALRPFELDRLGLRRAIAVMAEKAADSSGCKIETSLAEMDGLFSGEHQIALYRIVQESLTNVLKHSGAAWAWIEIAREKNALELRIQDNGRGFDAAGRESDGKGLGFSGMTERARILGGELRVESALGRGTLIRLRVPLGRNRDGENHE
ncbi:MAG: hypothetical protein HY735_22620 [Verrucomicrobia bacterium]|nr:hypothetical protein [Verrucomicrobiota bacterium]